MSAPSITDALPYTADSVAVSDLMIEEFSSWCNPKSAQLSPTTSCWCQADLITD